MRDITYLSKSQPVQPVNRTECLKGKSFDANLTGCKVKQLKSHYAQTSCIPNQNTKLMGQRIINRPEGGSVRSLIRSFKNPEPKTVKSNAGKISGMSLATVNTSSLATNKLRVFQLQKTQGINSPESKKTDQVLGHRAAENNRDIFKAKLEQTLLNKPEKKSQGRIDLNALKLNNNDSFLDARKLLENKLKVSKDEMKTSEMTNQELNSSRPGHETPEASSKPVPAPPPPPPIGASAKKMVKKTGVDSSKSVPVPPPLPPISAPAKKMVKKTETGVESNNSNPRTKVSKPKNSKEKMGDDLMSELNKVLLIRKTGKINGLKK